LICFPGIRFRSIHRVTYAPGCLTITLRIGKQNRRPVTGGFGITNVPIFPPFHSRANRHH